MLPSLTVPHAVRAPRNELRFDQKALLPTSKFTDCSICQMNFKRWLVMSRSPRKPMYEFCTSTARREPGVPIGAPAGRVPVVDTSVDTEVPGCDASLLLP